MDDVKQQVVDRLKQANNILVTVRTNPSIDLLSSCIGLALTLDKLSKHATAVFSGEVPSVMDFLKPEETLEQTPNSLRDFIIALDKTKADKLRYKVEDKVVRIFITPYKTSLSQDDLEFSQGDFNIDVIVALGVHDQAELDTAITAHGRILHDATVISINNTPNGNLGALNWQQVGASSVAEMIADLAQSLDSSVFDEQIATALLTGVVAETERFSNEKTTPQTMTIAGKLMAAGANQQLVANELQNSDEVLHSTSAASDAGTLEITHVADAVKAEEKQESESKPEPAQSEQPEAETQPEVAAPAVAPELPEEPKPAEGREMLPIPEPGEAGGSNSDALFTGEFSDSSPADGSSSYLIDHASDKSAVEQTPGAGQPAAFDLPSVTPSANLPGDGLPGVTLPDPSLPASLEPLQPGASLPESLPSTTPMSAFSQPAPQPQPEVQTETPASSQTLEEIEASVKNPSESKDELPQPTAEGAPGAASDTLAAGDRIDSARQEVLKALQQSHEPLPPVIALNASHIPLDEAAHEGAQPADIMPKADNGTPTAIEIDQSGNFRPVVAPAATQPEASSTLEPSAPAAMDMPLPPVAPQQQTTQQPAPFDPNSPPPVPPPMTPPGFFGQQ